MTDILYDPLPSYRDKFRKSFEEAARAEFAGLLKKSGVDTESNRNKVKEIKELEEHAEVIGFLKGFCRFICITAFIVAAIALSLCILAQDTYDNSGIATSVFFWAAGAGIIFLVLFFITRHNLNELQNKAEHKKDEAFEQMKPLNSLYTWDMIQKLITKTVPQIVFDKYFTEKRFRDLVRIYDFAPHWDENSSLLFNQSGVIAGNPFIFGEIISQEWETESYTGSLVIHWTEYETGPQGRTYAVHRSETLYASVEAPKPVYNNYSFLFYGNDAAPSLKFTRSPSELSGGKKGFWHSFRMKREIKKLENFSRNLSDDSNYTIMRNREFEALFKTTDRNNETEYRLLFTDVAQRQMLDLLKDTSVGFGDDFDFVKDCKINKIFADHIKSGDLDTDPALFYSYDAEYAEKFFVSFSSEFFRKIYFSLAPLLAIPVYQMTRNHEEIWKTVIHPGEPASDWEYETLANYHGEECFEHKNCITHSILKAEAGTRTGNAGSVLVTARGFRGVTRVEHIAVYGGDGYLHYVPVEWTEYIPVSRTSKMKVSEGEKHGQSFTYEFRNAAEKAFRRGIFSYLTK
ncbi:MAG: hypothetical protein J6Z08_04665 [Elusimicrobiales bacterium]|nr:hypothetical protein [Elusimicrobiales bacterium]